MTTKKQKTKLEQFKKLWKTKKALEQLENKELWQEIIGYYRTRTHKPKGSITWKDIAHRVFSEYVRLYYADDYGYCNCITCGVKLFRTDIQAGHFIKRLIMKYTFDITNVYPQCAGCNVMLNGNYIKYTLEMIKMLGKTEVEKRINDKQTVELKQYQYEEMILSWYEFICKKKAIIGQNQKQRVEYTTKTE